MKINSNSNKNQSDQSHIGQLDVFSILFEAHIKLLKQWLFLKNNRQRRTMGFIEKIKGFQRFRTGEFYDFRKCPIHKTSLEHWNNLAKGVGLDNMQVNELIKKFEIESSFSPD